MCPKRLIPNQKPFDLEIGWISYVLRAAFKSTMAVASAVETVQGQFALKPSSALASVDTRASPV